MELEGGKPEPLGATWDGAGVNVALPCAHATRVELCLFDPAEPAGAESRRLALPARTGDVWHGYLRGAGPGLPYGFRAHGPWRPAEGLRFDPAKLLVDPHARALSGPIVWDEGLVARPDGAQPSPDTAPFVPRAIVIDPAFDWQDDRPPRTPWSRSVLYECHVKGLTRLHPRLPEPIRGRYLGLAAPPVIDHLRALGVTGVELMPVQHAGMDAHLGRRALPNYWGYGTIGFFAPDARFASGGGGEQVIEFKTMVRELHRAGLEVILDVVYNHTPEGDPTGATFFLRGLDDRAYYRHDPLRPGEYLDFTGCGNSLDPCERPGLDLVLASLRYWVREMHVDGFRFDLAPALARDVHGRFDARAHLLERIRRDPLLQGVKLVAEPWDLGPDPDHLGAFPAPFAEWNGRYRDAVRRFWCSDPWVRPQLAAAVAGSSEVFGPGGRTPQASINLVTCHDGFTLLDVVSYAHKHNEANLEDNRDGRDGEPSRNWGVEGPTRSASVLRMRERGRRNMLATLALSLGVPMLSHGDELGRTQQGNNNAYCHDSELTWMDWRMTPAQEAFRDFVRRVFALRRANAAYRRRRHLTGERFEPTNLRDVTWLRPDGLEMAEADWASPGHVLGILLAAEAADPLDEEGEPQLASTALLLMNGGTDTVRFVLPRSLRAGRWVERLDTAGPAPPERDVTQRTVRAHSLALLEWEPSA